MMKTKRLLLSLTAAAALSAGAAPAAWALETEWVATGTVSDALDSSGIFGQAGTDLTGDAFTADFYIDTSKGSEAYAPGDYDEVEGGLAVGDSTPVTASLEINDVKYDFTGDNFGFAATGFAYGGIVAESDSYHDTFVTAELNTSTYPSRIGQSFSDSGSDQGSFFEITISGITQAGGFLSVNSIASAGAAAAPEPSAWALMIAGVGMVGATLRLGRRRGWAAA